MAFPPHPPCILKTLALSSQYSLYRYRQAAVRIPEAISSPGWTGPVFPERAGAPIPSHHCGPLLNSHWCFNDCLVLGDQNWTQKSRYDIMCAEREDDPLLPASYWLCPYYTAQEATGYVCCQGTAGSCPIQCPPGCSCSSWCFLQVLALAELWHSWHHPCMPRQCLLRSTFVIPKIVFNYSS